jgi:hypothetical protein
MATAIVAAEKLRRMNMARIFRRVGMSTSIVVTANTAHFPTGEKWRITIHRHTEGQLMVKLRRDPHGMTTFAPARRPDESRVTRKLGGPGGYNTAISSFGAVNVVSEETVEGGFDIVLPSVRPPVQKNNSEAKRRAIVQKAPSVVAPTTRWEDVRSAVRTINDFVGSAPGEFDIQLRPEGGIRITRLDVAE